MAERLYHGGVFVICSGCGGHSPNLDPDGVAPPDEGLEAARFFANRGPLLGSYGWDVFREDGQDRYVCPVCGALALGLLGCALQAVEE